MSIEKFLAINGFGQQHNAFHLLLAKTEAVT